MPTYLTSYMHNVHSEWEIGTKRPVKFDDPCAVWFHYNLQNPISAHGLFVYSSSERCLVFRTFTKLTSYSRFVFPFAVEIVIAKLWYVENSRACFIAGLFILASPVNKLVLIMLPCKVFHHCFALP